MSRGARRALEHEADHRAGGRRREASLRRVVRDQRKTILGRRSCSSSPTYWILGQLGEWTPRRAASPAASCSASLNHLVTEFWLLRLIASGEQPTRKQLAVSTLVRLAVLSVVAVGIAVWFWPDGIGLLLGLAIFRLIALVMTTIPLLKELKNQ